MCLILVTVLMGMAQAQSFTEQHSEKLPVNTRTDVVDSVGDISVVAWDQQQVAVDWTVNGYTK